MEIYTDAKFIGKVELYNGKLNRGQIEYNLPDEGGVLATTDYVQNVKTEISEVIENLDERKADKADTLAGYGITDAYTKSEIEEKYYTKDAIHSGVLTQTIFGYDPLDGKRTNKNIYFDEDAGIRFTIGDKDFWISKDSGTTSNTIALIGDVNSSVTSATEQLMTRITAHGKKLDQLIKKNFNSDESDADISNWNYWLKTDNSIVKDSSTNTYSVAIDNSTIKFDSNNKLSVNLADKTAPAMSSCGLVCKRSDGALAVKFATTKQGGVFLDGGNGLSLTNGVLAVNLTNNHSGLEFVDRALHIKYKNVDDNPLSRDCIPVVSTSAEGYLAVKKADVVGSVPSASTSSSGVVQLASALDSTGNVVATASQVYNGLSLKANWGTTLSDYYIGDAYTKTEVNELIAHSYKATSPQMIPVNDVATWIVTHNLNSEDVVVQVVDTETKKVVAPSIEIKNANEVKIEFTLDSEVVAGKYKVVILK